MIPTHSRSQKLLKDEYRQRVDDLRVRLINAQYDLRTADFPVVILLVGDDRVGAAGVSNRLNEWMDSRFLETMVLGRETQEQSEHPSFWQLWRALPPKGRAGLWAGGVMHNVADFLSGDMSRSKLYEWARSMRHFQQDLVADGALLLKFYIHTPKEVQDKRAHKADADEAWRYEKRDWEAIDSSLEGRQVVEDVMRKMTIAGAPWQVVDGTHKRNRDVLVAETITEAIEHRLEAGPPTLPAAPISAFSSAPNYLAAVDLSLTTPKKEYKKELARLQSELHELADEARRQGVPTVLAFEGWDAGGKGGTIRRLTSALEAGDYRVHSVAAPTEHERQFPYLWRFWRDLPRDGRIAIFDRTWYGRVLVERIEGFATEAEWQRAYAEIVGFEEQLASHGTYLGKFWLHLSQDEQLARFKAREDTPYKKHKITDEDYRNRERWDDYVIAINEMIARTSTMFAPWTVVPADDKPTGRLTVLRAVIAGLQEHLEE